MWLQDVMRAIVIDLPLLDSAWSTFTVVTISISFSSLTLQEMFTKSGSYVSLLESTDCFIKVYDLDPKALRGVCVCM